MTGSSDLDATPCLELSDHPGLNGPDGIGRLRLRAGQLAFLEGESGSGKTRLLRQLVDLEPDLGCEVRVAGRPLRSLEPGELRRRLGLLPQELPIHAGTGRELRGLLIAGLRTVVQLTLVGYVLQRVFAVEQPLLVLGILVLMVLAAASTIGRRSSHAFPGRWFVAVGSISSPAFLMVGYGVYFVIRPADWADPRYLIPLMGMVLGNSLTAVHLTMDRYTGAIASQRRSIEHLLCLGASPQEATLALAREAVRSGMTPIVNAMSIAGIVSLPGMMTGQILGGTPPLMAVRYQIVIMFLLAGATALGSALCVLWLRRRLFDARERITPELVLRATTNAAR